MLTRNLNRLKDRLPLGGGGRRHLGVSLRKKLLAGAALIALTLASSAADPYVPEKWTRFVKVEGQSEPVPEQWLREPEARIAHSLKLPEAVPKTVPFDFTKAYWASWLPGTPKRSVQYFNHLCRTEAGEWIFKKVQNVEGFYFARPQAPPTTDVLTDPYGPEMPWIQRIFLLKGDSLYRQGAWFVQPPLYNYRFMEQPRRDVKWQAGIAEPYIRLFGYTQEPMRRVDGSSTPYLKEKTPMRVVGIPKLTARYGYTWRGLKRARDREHGIAGGELIIFDLQTKEVLAVRRQFLIASRNPRGEGKAMWEIAARCAQLPQQPVGLEFTQFAFDVIETIEPSKAGK